MPVLKKREFDKLLAAGAKKVRLKYDNITVDTLPSGSAAGPGSYVVVNSANQLVVSTVEVNIAGNNKQIQYNSSGSLAASENFSFDGDTFRLTGSMYLSSSKGNNEFPLTIMSSEDSGEYLQCLSRDGAHPSIELRQGGGGNGGVMLYDDSGNNRLYLEGDSSPKIEFRNDSDNVRGFIKYHEGSGGDWLTISGSRHGLVLSGGIVQIDGTLQGASPLKIGGEVQFTSAGENAAFNFGPNQEAKIFYKDGNTGALIISGSDAHGTAISGSVLTVHTTNGIGVGIENSSVTHAITLPNNDNTTGRIKANAFVSYSSQRFKKDIKTLQDPIETLKNINVVSFKWKDTDRLDYGFIAEDVGKVLPNIVTWEDNKKDAQGMDYLKIISFLVEAVKKQQKEIDELKHKFSSQSSE